MTRFTHPYTKISVFFFFFLTVLLLSIGCGSTSNNDNDTKETPPTEEVTETEVSQSRNLPIIRGNVSNGFAITNAAVFVVTPDNSEPQQVATTDEEGNYDFEAASTLTVPFLIFSQAVDETVVSSVVPSVPNEGEQQTANVNPMTQVVTQSVLGEDAPAVLQRLAARRIDGAVHRLVAIDLNLVNQDDLFYRTGETFSLTAFNESVPFRLFDSATFTAKTEEDPAAGGFPDSLVETLAAQDSTRTVSEILSISVDPNDPTFGSGLLSNPEFQANLSGELISQGRTAEDAIALITAAPSSANADAEAAAAQMIENTTKFLNVFDSSVRESINSSGVDTDSATLIIRAAAAATGQIVSSTGVGSGDALDNIINNAVQSATPALINVSTDPSNESLLGSGGLGTLLSAVGNEVSEVVVDTAGDLTAPLDTDAVAALQTQVNNFAQVMAAPLSASLQDPEVASLPAVQQNLLLNNVSNQVSTALAPFIGDLAQDTIPETVQNVANNTAGPLRESLKTVVADPTTASLDAVSISEVLETVADVSRQQLQQFDLTAADADLIAATNLVTNLGKVVTQTTATANESAGGLTDQRAKASVLSATVSQALDQVVELTSQGQLDLTGEDLPLEAQTAADNIAQVVGSALSDSVAGTSNRRGENLDVLVKSAAAEATQQLVETVGDLTAPVDVASVQTVVAEKAVEASIALEQTFQQIENSGVDLGAITKSFEENGLNPEAISVVAVQVAETFGTGEGDAAVPSDALIQAAGPIAEAAAKSANNALGKGASLDNVKELVAVSTTALKDIGESGDFLTINNSAKALTSTIESVGGSDNFDFEEFLEVTRDVGSVITASAPTPVDDSSGVDSQPANFKDLLSSVQQKVSSGEPITLEELVADAPIQDIEQVAAVRDEQLQAAADSIQAADDRFNAIQQTAQDAVEAGGADLEAVFQQFNPAQQELEIVEEFLAAIGPVAVDPTLDDPGADGVVDPGVGNPNPDDLIGDGGPAGDGGILDGGDLLGGDPLDPLGPADGTGDPLGEEDVLDPLAGIPGEEDLGDQEIGPNPINSAIFEQIAAAAAASAVAEQQAAQAAAQEAAAKAAAVSNGPFSSIRVGSAELLTGAFTSNSITTVVQSDIQFAGAATGNTLIQLAATTNSVNFTTLTVSVQNLSTSTTTETQLNTLFFDGDTSPPTVSMASASVNGADANNAVSSSLDSTVLFNSNTTGGNTLVINTTPLLQAASAGSELTHDTPYLLTVSLGGGQSFSPSSTEINTLQGCFYLSSSGAEAPLGSQTQCKNLLGVSAIGLERCNTPSQLTINNIDIPLTNPPTVGQPSPAAPSSGSISGSTLSWSTVSATSGGTIGYAVFKCSDPAAVNVSSPGENWELVNSNVTSASTAIDSAENTLPYLIIPFEKVDSSTLLSGTTGSCKDFQDGNNEVRCFGNFLDFQNAK